MQTCSSSSSSSSARKPKVITLYVNIFYLKIHKQLGFAVNTVVHLHIL